jgi:hypothetical protein
MQAAGMTDAELLKLFETGILPSRFSVSKFWVIECLF